MKRLPNGYGGVTRLSGKRTKPFMAWIPHKKIVSGKTLHKYYKDVSELEQFVDSKEFENKEFEKDIKNLIMKYSIDEYEIERKKIPIGYYQTRQEALNALAEYNKAPVDGDLKNLTFAQIWHIVKKTLDVQEKTIKHYDASFKHCADIHNKKISAIKTDDMQRCINYASEVAPSTQDTVIMVCNYIFKYAVKNDIVQKNYAQHLKGASYSAEERVPFSKEEIQKVLANRDWRYKTKYKAKTTGFDMPRAVILLIYTGVRINELLGIRKEHIHLDERYIEIFGTKTKNAERIVPIHRDIEGLLETPCDYLIYDNNMKPIKYATFEKSIWEQYCEDFGFDHRVHDTRHTFVTIAEDCELSPLKLRKIVGHTTKKLDLTDKVYTHPYIESLIEEIDKFSVT